MTTRILMIGAGGIGCPVALALATAHARAEFGDAELLVVDDDLVEAENLHRQVLFEVADIGKPKADALASRVRSIAPGLRVVTLLDRFLPHTASELAAAADVIVDASDNFATRFLAADAAHLARKPLVSAASIRWVATVLLGQPGAACYRCVFEDIPSGDAPDCATAGIIGPICAVAGSLAAELAIAIAQGVSSPRNVFSYDGRTDVLRAFTARSRESCALCGPRPEIASIDPARYVAASCDADGPGAA